MSLRHPASRAIAATLRHEGGWWTQRELLHHLAPAVDGRDLSKRLNTLARDGYIQRHRRIGHRPRFGVTHSCKPIEPTPTGATT